MARAVLAAAAAVVVEGASWHVCCLWCTAHRSGGLAHRAAAVDWAICAAGWQYALAGLQHACPGGVIAVLLGGPQVGTASMPSPYSRARTAWLAFALCTLRYHRLHCSKLSLQPCLSSHHTTTTNTTLSPSLTFPLLSRVHVPALAVRSSALSPAVTGRSRSLRRRPPAPSSPPTASSPPPPPLVTLARISALSCVCTTTSFA